MLAASRAMTDTDLRRVDGVKFTDRMLPRDSNGLVSATYGSDKHVKHAPESGPPAQVMYKLTRTGHEAFEFTASVLPFAW